MAALYVRPASDTPAPAPRTRLVRPTSTSAFTLSLCSMINTIYSHSSASPYRAPMKIRVLRLCAAVFEYDGDAQATTHPPRLFSFLPFGAGYTTRTPTGWPYQYTRAERYLTRVLRTNGTDSLVKDVFEALLRQRGTLEELDGAYLLRNRDALLVCERLHATVWVISECVGLVIHSTVRRSRPSPIG